MVRVLLVAEVYGERERNSSSGQSAGYPSSSRMVLFDREDRYASGTFSHTRTSVVEVVYIRASRSLKSSAACAAKSSLCRAEMVGALIRHDGLW